MKIEITKYGMWNWPVYEITQYIIKLPIIWNNPAYEFTQYIEIMVREGRKIGESAPTRRWRLVSDNQIQVEKVKSTLDIPTKHQYSGGGSAEEKCVI